MNEHETERIAAAMNQARPDWPLQQLRTLLRDQRVVDRPRRDVFVALAWVASEPHSASPYRVLENGPWWRAAGIEGSTTRREPWDPGGNCANCSEPEDRCRALWAEDHDYISQAKHMQQVATEKLDTARIADALRAEVQPMRDPKPTPDLKHQPAGRSSEHVQALRDATTPAPQATAAGTDEAASAAQEEA